jgi:hypothetical protein
MKLCLSQPNQFLEDQDGASLVQRQSIKSRCSPSADHPAEPPLPRNQVPLFTASNGLLPPVFSPGQLHLGFQMCLNSFLWIQISCSQKQNTNHCRGIVAEGWALAFLGPRLCLHWCTRSWVGNNLCYYMH